MLQRYSRRNCRERFARAALQRSIAREVRQFARISVPAGSNNKKPTRPVRVCRVVLCFVCGFTIDRAMANCVTAHNSHHISTQIVLHNALASAMRCELNVRWVLHGSSVRACLFWCVVCRGFCGVVNTFRTATNTLTQ